MLKSHFDELRRRKACAENRNLPIRTIAQETQLAITTIQRVKTGSLNGTQLSTVEKLCQYFQADSISDLIEFVPDS